MCSTRTIIRCHNPEENITKLQEVNQMCRSVETVKCVCKLTFWKAADIVNMKRETVKLTVTINNIQVHMISKTSNKILTFFGRGQV